MDPNQEQIRTKTIELMGLLRTALPKNGDLVPFDRQGFNHVGVFCGYSGTDALLDELHFLGIIQLRQKEGSPLTARWMAPVNLANSNIVDLLIQHRRTVEEDRKKKELKEIEEKRAAELKPEGLLKRIQDLETNCSKLEGLINGFYDLMSAELTSHTERLAVLEKLENLKLENEADFEKDEELIQVNPPADAVAQSVRVGFIGPHSRHWPRILQGLDKRIFPVRFIRERTPTKIIPGLDFIVASPDCSQLMTAAKEFYRDDQIIRAPSVGKSSVVNAANSIFK